MRGNFTVRDPRLQPERTTLAWQRTAFTVLVFSMAVIRIGFSRTDIPSSMLAIAGGILAMAVVRLSYLRQKSIIIGSELTTRSSVLAKSLLSATLCLVAGSLVLHAVITLINKGNF